MAAKLNKEAHNYLNNLLLRKEYNINIADVLLTCFNYTDFFNISELEKVKNNVSQYKKLYLKQIFEKFEIPNTKDNLEQISKSININKLDPIDYQNEYTKTFSKAFGKHKNYSIKKITYKPYQLFASDEIDIDGEFYAEISNVGFFTEKFDYLALCENENVWMSLNPNEINTMKPYISKAKGNILVLGLGLGYMPFMASLKSDVKTITIVEKDHDIIDIFNNVLFKSFPYKNKINIIEGDAIQFLEKSRDFDYVFADLWHTPEDGLELYLKIKEIAFQKSINVDCWLEKSLEAYIRRFKLTLLEENQLGYTNKDYENITSTEDKILHDMYYKYEVNEICDYNSIFNFIK